jgi:RNA polymerase sigma-70 factor (ECF subfamily)
MPGTNISPTSFEEAFRSYANRVARWARRLGGYGNDIDNDVEAVVQGVFLVVHKKLPSFKGTSFSSWLFEITRKIVANQRRSRHRQVAHRQAERELGVLSSQGVGPDDLFESKQAATRIYRALDQLPEKYRTVFILYQMDGLSDREIAELCRLNLSTVRVHLMRARGRFMLAYQNELREEASLTGLSLMEIGARYLWANPPGVSRRKEGA